ncbi:MAG TPA: enoyl-CoA hydratase/isomerase family protein [Actinomycetota bacterium]|nr:enoyl-CoA hydratase/isomerase family protein [Actinomycetota bacterium]
MHSVDVTVRGHVAEVKLSRPEARNALSQSLCRALTEEMVALEERTEIRVVLISGEGAVFCAGADLSAVSGPQALEFLAVFEEMLEAVARHPKPTIAVLHGAALGGGLQLATVCDFRVAGRSARVGIPAASLGIVVNLENVERLVRLAGPARAKEILMAGRMFSGEEAKASGLLTSAVEDGEEAESARLLAERMDGACAPGRSGREAGHRRGYTRTWGSQTHGAAGRVGDRPSGGSRLRQRGPPGRLEGRGRKTGPALFRPLKPVIVSALLVCLRQGSAAGKPRREGVVMGHFRLTQSPAEKHALSLHDRGKVDDAFIEVTQYDVPSLEPAKQLVDAGKQSVPAGWTMRASVLKRDARHSLTNLGRPGELFLQLDERGGEMRQKRVGLGNRVGAFLGAGAGRVSQRPSFSLLACRGTTR